MSQSETGKDGSYDGPRRHMCAVFRQDSDRNAAVIPFLLEGLRRNDACIYVADHTDKSDLFDRLMASAAVSKDWLEERVDFIRTDEVYLEGGRFDKDRTLGYFDAVCRRALDTGHSGLTVTGEMSWASRGMPGSDDLVKYESLVNSFSVTSHADILCQYPESEFDAETLVNVVRAHPKVIVKGMVCGNPYYLAPETLIPLISGSVTMDVMGQMEKDMFSRSVISEISKLETKDLRRARLCLNVLDEMVLEDFRDRLTAASFFNELALETCKDLETSSHIRSAESKLKELSERLEALRMFRSCMDAPTEWQSLGDVLSSAVERAVGDSRKVAMGSGSYRIHASTAADKAFAAFVGAVAERSNRDAVIEIDARLSEFGLTVAVAAEGQGVPEASKEALFEKAGPCECGKSLCLARELLESSGLSVREVGIPGRSIVFEVHFPNSRCRSA